MSAAGPDGSGRVHHSRLTRTILSVVFGFHFLAIGVYLLPADREAYDVLPEGLREPAIRLTAPVIYNLTPVTAPWLDATWTRQNWKLFAPEPSAWNVSGEIVAWFPRRPDALDLTERWSSDTLAMPSGEHDPYPHFGRGRIYRVALDMGETGRGEFLQRWYASALCRRLTDSEGNTPDGVEIRLFWNAILPPWAEEREGEYVQTIGGFNCWELEGRPRPWWSTPTLDTLGLPAPQRAPFRRGPA